MNFEYTMLTVMIDREIMIAPTSFKLDDQNVALYSTKKANIE